MNFPSSKLAAILLVELLLAMCVSHAALADDARPNILFIMTDDQERREFNFLPEGRDEQGKPRNLSPNLDRLAAEGVVFPNQYVTSPVPGSFAEFTDE